MKIIEPSAEIIEDELSSLSVYQRIDRCTSVCYQRPPKPTEDDARAFCKKLVDLKHFAALEMAVVHLLSDIVDVPSSKYITHTMLDARGERCVITGSIRALLEADGEYGSHVWNLLADQYPVFFAESDLPGNRVRFAEPHEIPWQHQHVAVRFIVNRAVSHELVRHRPCSFLQESQRYCRYGDDVVFVRPEWWSQNMLLNANTKALAWNRHMVNSEIEYKTLLREKLTPQQARAVLPNSTKTELIVYASLPQWKHIFGLRCSAAADPEMVRVMRPLRDEFRKKYAEAFKD